MKAIVEGRAEVVLVWGRQAVKRIPHRLMKYTVCTECSEGTLILNVISGELVLLDQDEKVILKQSIILPDESTEELVAHHFLVPVDYDEKAVVYSLRAILKKQKQLYVRGIQSYTILPTTGCNARCFYCYESTFPHFSMSAETADSVIEFISNHCEKEKPVNLHWFGGEPMVAVDRIDQICKGLIKKGVSFRSRMTSNASLFSERLAQRARKGWHLYEIQITLDGTEKIYNDTKAYTSFNGNPYETVLNNIGYLLEQKVRVIIRLNLGLHNISVMNDLIRELMVLYGGYDNLVVYTGILFNNLGFEKVQHTEKDIEKLELAKRELKHTIDAAGIRYAERVELPYLKLEHCMADNPETVLISPNGDLGKCEHAVYEKLIGTIQSDAFDEDRKRKWEEIRIWPECEECCVYPNCIMLHDCETLEPCNWVALENRIDEIRTRMVEKYQSSTVL